MDFFEHQERARRHTFRLVVCFALAVVLIIVAVYLAVAFVLLGAGLKAGGGARGVWLPELFALVSLSTLVLVIGGSLYRIWSLAEGGEAVARMLGGHLLNPNTADLRERRLLNVVEEMAIASGTPVPLVYVLPEEEGINAFAAGLSPSAAVIGVTRGCLERLTRDELQGVVAHEFSHVLNGDMRLNLRLIGVLHGILLISLVGYAILRGVLHSGSRSGRRSGKGGGGVLVIALFGLLLMIIGYIGVFFGRLIKSAVSRQREFLADAAAVQFTRNPTGLSGALKKIGGLVAGSRVSSPNAEAASHLFFGNALGASLLHLMATHPPLAERIRRIDPAFDGVFPASAERVVESTAAPLFHPEVRTPQTAPGPAAAASAFTAVPASVVAQVGAPSPAHLAHARTLRESLPARLVDAAREPYGARAVVFGLLLDRDSTVRERQLQALARSAAAGVYEYTRRLLPDLAGLARQQQLPLVDMAVPALQQLSRSQYAAFRQCVTELVEADAQIDLFEYALQCILMRHLEVAHRRAAVVSYHSLNPVAHECAVLLSALAYVGAENEAAARRTLVLAAGKIGLPAGTVKLLPPEQAGLAAVAQALERLATVGPLQKRQVLAACSAAVLADRTVTVEEAELLRAVAAALDCPMPPLIP